MQTPRVSHYQALLHTIQYITTTVNQGNLMNGSVELTIQAFSDSDRASCTDIRRFLTGYLVLLGNSTVSWKFKKQSTVSRSSFEDEYRAIAAASIF